MGLAQQPYVVSGTGLPWSVVTSGLDMDMVQIVGCAQRGKQRTGAYDDLHISRGGLNAARGRVQRTHWRRTHLHERARGHRGTSLSTRLTIDDRFHKLRDTAQRLLCYEVQCIS